MKKKKHRICSRCKQEKTVFNFYRRTSRKRGYHYTCKKCDQKNYKKNSERIRIRNLMQAYNLTKEQYNNLNKIQSGVCLICKNKCEIHGHLSVDHNHFTGAVRGLLCSHCNKGLGCFKDNINLLLKAADYLYEGTRQTELSIEPEYTAVIG